MPAIQNLLARYRALDERLAPVETPERFIAFLESERVSGDSGTLKRAFSLRVGPGSYPARYFERGPSERADFYEHLRAFAHWIALHPGAVRRQTMSEQAILPYFKTYLQALSTQALVKHKGLFQAYVALKSSACLPERGLDTLDSYLPQGLVLAFHADLVQEQALILKQLTERNPVQRETVTNHSDYRLLTWARTPFVKGMVEERAQEQESVKRKRAEPFKS